MDLPLLFLYIPDIKKLVVDHRLGITKTDEEKERKKSKYYVIILNHWSFFLEDVVCNLWIKTVTILSARSKSYITHYFHWFSLNLEIKFAN